MAISTAYSFINVSAVLDGQLVIGLWDGDDAIVVTKAADVGTGLVGADGSGIFSVSASRAATISIKLQHNSPAHRLLMQKLKRQQALGGLATGFTFSIIDSASGEGGKGVNAVVREWVLWTADYNDEIPNV